VLYGFSWKDVLAFYQIGWEARWARRSMGSVLIYHALRIAAANGVRTFDFLRGAEAYKYRFGAVDRHDRTWLLPQGPAGMLLAAKYRVRQLANPRLRAPSTTSRDDRNEVDECRWQPERRVAEAEAMPSGNVLGDLWDVG